MPAIISHFTAPAGQKPDKEMVFVACLRQFLFMNWVERLSILLTLLKVYANRE